MHFIINYDSSSYTVCVDCYTVYDIIDYGLSLTLFRLVHQASFSVPISNQVYMENEKGLAKPSEGPGSTNTFTPAGTTVHSSPLKRNSTSSSIASGGYVEMKGGALEDIISPPSSSTLSRISVPPAANPGWHTTQSLQHASTVSSTLPINPLDYENATAWILAEKIKEQNRIDCTDAADLPPTKPKLVATYQGDGLGSNHQPRSALTPPYLESTGEVVLQPPKLPPKRYKEIEFMTMEPTSEYMRPNISSSSLPRDPVTERSFKTHSNPHTLGRV